MNVILHPAAEREFSEAFKWYEKRMTGLGTEFSNMIDETVHRVKNSPLSFPICYKTVPKAVLKKFPYILLFSMNNSDIMIIAISHTGRNPLEWHKRK